MGKVVSGVGGGLGNLLFGRKQTQEADPIAGQVFSTAQNASSGQQSALSRISDRLDTGKDLAGIQVENQVRGLEGSRDDARRRIEGLVRQRGLGNTSAGLSAMLGADRDIAEKIAAQRAQLPLLQDQISRERAMDLLEASNAVVGSQNLPLNLRRQTGRSGGIAEILGGVIGGSLGGTEGAKIGIGAGQIGRGLFG